MSSLIEKVSNGPLHLSRLLIVISFLILILLKTLLALVWGRLLLPSGGGPPPVVLLQVLLDCQSAVVAAAGGCTPGWWLCARTLDGRLKAPTDDTFYPRTSTHRVQCLQSVGVDTVGEQKGAEGTSCSFIPEAGCGLPRQHY